MKTKRIWILMSIIIVVLITVVGYMSIPQTIPVLTYHNFTRRKKSESMTIAEEEFEKQISFLSKHNYHSLTLEEVECFMDNTCKIPNKSVLITMDDGWKNVLEIAAPILKKYNMNATLFYIGRNIEENNKEILNKDDLNNLKEKYPNIEIASHSYNLHQENSYLLPKEDIKKDIEIMKGIIENPYYAYPYGKHSTKYREALQEENYHLAFTFGPGKEHRKITRKDDKYALPRLNMSDGMPFWKFIARLIWIK